MLLANTQILATLYAVVGILVVAQSANALRMINLDVPETAFPGDTIHLSCSFRLNNPNKSSSLNADDLNENPRQTALRARSKSDKTAQNSDITFDREPRAEEEEAPGEFELLYAIKWYKDEREFFRYLAHDWPRKQWLPMDGVVVDVEESDNHTVVLKNVSLKTSGTFRCEVSTDAPSFVSKSIKRRMSIYSLPNEGPVIKKVPNNSSKATRYNLGDRLEFTCLSSESKPPASIDWIIDGLLNISGSSLASYLGQMFTVKNQRFVTLPSLNSSSIARPHGQTPYLSYEILNTTLALDKSGHSVSLTESIDQFLEISSSKLNFTIDANLLQLLASKLKPSRSRSDASRETIATQATREPVLSRPSAGSSIGVSSREIKSGGFQLKTNTFPLASISQPDSYQSTSSFVVSSKRRRPMKEAQVMNDNHNFVLKIKCVARVLHLSMSDEIKIQFTNKVGDDQNQYNAHQSHVSRANNSGTMLAKSFYGFYFIIIAVSVLYTTQMKE